MFDAGLAAEVAPRSPALRRDARSRVSCGPVGRLHRTAALIAEPLVHVKVCPENHWLSGGSVKAIRPKEGPCRIVRIRIAWC